MDLHGNSYKYKTMKNKDSILIEDDILVKNSRRVFLRYSALPLLTPLYPALGALSSVAHAQDEATGSSAQAEEKTQAETATELDTETIEQTQELATEEEQTTAPLPDAQQQFMRIAPILCDKTDIRPQMLNRAFEVLEQNNPQFQEELQALFELIETENITNASDLMKNKAFTENALAKQAAQQTLTALYTGRIGENGQSKLVGYEHALMFRPTADITTIPSYSGGSFAYWVEPPVVVQ